MQDAEREPRQVEGQGLTGSRTTGANRVTRASIILDRDDKIEQAKSLAKQLYDLCQDDEVCAAVANMIWDDGDPEHYAGDDAEEFVRNVGSDAICEMQTALRLPNVTGELKDDSNDGTIIWGKADG
jgi:hypothetical protein